VTEAEWQSCNDPAVMLEALRSSGRANRRKLRLFAVACCNRVRYLLTDRRSKAALEAAEQYADGILLDLPREYYRAGKVQASPMSMGTAAAEAAKWVVHPLAESAAHIAASACAMASESVADERQYQAGLLRCVMANPFMTKPDLDRSWLNGTVARLAQAIYDERAFDRMPILADALEDAGCHDENLLRHCRHAAEHCRGCWVVDLLLGKE
jgi:hypothetical protein